MISLNVNESKNIEFDINVSGTDPSNIKGYLRFNKNDVEYGFPVVVEGGSVKVNIPNLSSFIKENLQDGEKVDARLDIVANGDTYIMPWTDQLLISTPLKMEAKVKGVEDVKESKPTISIGKIFDVEVKTDTIDEKECSKDKKRKPKSKFGKALEG